MMLDSKYNTFIQIEILKSWIEKNSKCKNIFRFRAIILGLRPLGPERWRWTVKKKMDEIMQNASHAYALQTKPFCQGNDYPL